MLKGKKMASRMRKGKSLLVKMVEDGLWISDTHFLVKLKPGEANEFYSTYNNYKTTEEIPQLKVGQTYAENPGGSIDSDGDPVGQVLDCCDSGGEEVVEVEDLCQVQGGKLHRIFRLGEELGAFDHEYSWLLEELNFDRVVSAGLLDPIVFLKEGETVGLLMPVRKRSGGLDRTINRLRKRAV